MTSAWELISLITNETILNTIPSYPRQKKKGRRSMEGARGLNVWRARVGLANQLSLNRPADLV